MTYFEGTSIPTGVLDNANANRIVDEYLTPNLLMFRQIEVHDEQLIALPDRETWKAVWGNILQNETVSIVRAGKVLNEDEYYVDYKAGKLTFLDQTEDYKIPLGTTTVDIYSGDGTPAIDVTMSYKFDYFPSEVLYSMVKQSLTVVNSLGNNNSPTSYTIKNMPSYYDGPVTDLAYAKCMEKLLLDFDLWKSRLIFAVGPDSLLEGNGGDIVGQLQTLKRNAEERAYKVLDNPRFKSGYVTTTPTDAYWRAVRSVGITGYGTGGDTPGTGRYRGWKPNRVSF
jgi:hypothetical protein